VQYRTLNPATEELVETFPNPTAAEVDEVLRLAETGFSHWRTTRLGERRKLLLEMARLLEARVMVRKILAYESAETSLLEGRVVLVADNPDRAGDFIADAEALAATLGSDQLVTRRYQPGATRQNVVQSFDEGASLVSYLGHGAIHRWADENVFNASDVETLTSQSQQPLLLTMTCLNGYFHFPYFDSLAEVLLKAEDKGVIAVFSPSGLSLNAPANLYQQALVDELFHGGHDRIGDAVLAAQIRYAKSGAHPSFSPSTTSSQVPIQLLSLLATTQM